MWGTGHWNWTLWHPVVLDCTRGLRVVSLEEAADAALKSRGCSRRPKWQASIKSRRSYSQKSHNSSKLTDFLNIFSVSTAMDFHCEKGQGGLLYKEVFLRGYEIDNIVSLSLPFLCHHPLDVSLCKERTYLLPTFEPECLGLLKKKKNLSTFIMICRVFPFIFL